uniref:Putative rna-binding protein rsf1-like isoform x2 neodiprion lecontei n=1 Tax=Xenopsylla cheopis TaxID=163159 RepID=A0A6M2DEW9_XENCH
MGDGDYSKGTRVYVGGLSDSIKKEDLEGEFEKFGKLNNVWVAFNPPGFAFIEFASKDEAETACDNLNGTEVLGSKLRVEISRGRGRGPRGGGGGGFRGSRGGGFRGGRGGGFRGNYDSGSRGGGFRGRGRGRGSFDRDSYGGGRGGYGSRDNYGGRDSNRESFGNGGYDSYGGGRDGGSRYRSRSPVGGRRY